ncbi:MAG: alpha-L-fucosidase [Marinilabiliaceae bacterium]|nr:alpha-L-fucosidase [Marinilabiliaceae bacterium]
MKKLLPCIACVLSLAFAQCTMVDPPRPVLPVPTADQLKWNEMERNAFIHFGLNTFTDQEWGYGSVPAATFNPTELDVNQWCQVIKEAGLKGIILTAKHHDGFCLWPSEYTEYSVKNSPWRNGKGDLVKELSDACRQHGLKFGVYLSPWDRNSAVYSTPEYITYFRNQLTELLTNYGDIFEVWFDGANGGTGYYGGADEKRSVDRKTYYDWPTTIALVRKLQPNALIFSDAGPDVRWCGNESGVGGKTNWSTLRRDEAWPGWPRYKELNPGHEDGNYWVPAEINTSVRPGWFYHKSEDHRVKSVSRLMDYFYESVGRNGTGLLNFPIDDRGLIHENDAANVIEWQKTISSDLAHNLLLEVDAIEASNVRGKARRFNAQKVNDQNAETYWASDDGVTSADLVFEFDEAITFNRFLVQEYITLGQRVKTFTVDILTQDNKWKEVASETTIGYKRILRLPDLTTRKIRFRVTGAKACPTISNVELFNAPQLITSPRVSRNKEGVVTITNDNTHLDLFYTLDGSEPDEASLRYEKPFVLNGKANVKVVAVDAVTKRKSDVVTAAFDISKSNWKVLHTDDKRCGNILDGNERTSWHQQHDKMPGDLVIDLGESVLVEGFRYLPDQGHRPKGIIFNFAFYTSPDGKLWSEQSSGEFSNIKNSPVWQKKVFAPVQARYIRLRALNTVADEKLVRYSEFDVITK